jgi:hypothetical protein
METRLDVITPQLRSNYSPLCDGESVLFVLYLFFFLSFLVRVGFVCPHHPSISWQHKKQKTTNTFRDPGILRWNPLQLSKYSLY